MVNSKKVRAMVQNRVFEDQNGKTVLKLKERCEDRPFWKSFGFNALGGVLLYILVMILLIAAFPDWFLERYESMGSALCAVSIALSLAVCAIIYSMISEAVFKRLYRRVRSTLCKYRVNQLRLEKIKREQEL
ncbi:MAG: hypothetical protein IJ106_13995 [Parasporobacterium sp.]|nr:hypothetical protein [Parasporobacterium sp.]